MPGVRGTADTPVASYELGSGNAGSSITISPGLTLSPEVWLPKASDLEPAPEAPASVPSTLAGSAAGDTSQAASLSVVRMAMDEHSNDDTNLHVRATSLSGMTPCMSTWLCPTALTGTYEFVGRDQPGV